MTRNLAHRDNSSQEEGPGGGNTSEEIVSHTHSPTLSNAQSTGLDSGSHLQLAVSPNDGLDQLLPVAAATEQEHQAKGPNKVGTQEHQTIGRQSRAVGADHLGGLRPQEVTQPAVDSDGASGKIAASDVRHRTIGAHRTPNVGLHLPAEVEDHNG